MAKLVFFGTPDYVLPVLEELKSAGNEIVAVVTQPPKPVGRKKEVTPSPVAEWAKSQQVPIFDRAPKELVEPLKKTEAEVGVLSAYGKILPAEILNVFPKGILNLHPSLLPKYRGASPVAAAIAAGDRETGVTIIIVDEEVDHGAIVAQFREKIGNTETRGNLRSCLFGKAAEVLVTILPAYLEGRIKPREQDHKKASYTSLVKKKHGFIPPEHLKAVTRGQSISEQWPIPFIKNFTVHPPSPGEAGLRGASPSPVTIHRFIRAMNPWPGAWTKVKFKVQNSKFKIKRLKILKAHLEKSPITDLPTGALAKAGHRSPIIKLVLDQVQLEGKNPVSWEQFKQGYPEAEIIRG